MAWEDFYDERHWTTKPAHTYAPRQVWFPLAHAVCSWEDEFHTLMLHDHMRMYAFRRAIRQAVGHLLRQRTPADEPLRILDIGTGYGILAFWAAEAASDRELVPNPNPGVRVYAVEANPVTASRAIRELSAKNVLWDGASNPTNKILVFNVPSYRLNRTLAANRCILKRFDPHFVDDTLNKAFPLAAFDLIVSETLGNIGDNEDGVRLLHHATLSFLKPSGHVIPAEVRSYLVPVADVASTPDSTGLHDSVRCAKDGGVKAVNPEYLERLRTTPTCFDWIYDAVIPLDDYLSQKQEIHHWRFSPQHASGPKEYSYTKEFSFDCDRAGRFIGFKGFFSAILVPEGVGGRAVTLDIEPEDVDGRKTSDCWKHCYLPVNTPFEVAAGDCIVTSFQRRVAEPKHEEFTYVWEGHIERDSERVPTFRQEYTANTPYHRATDPVGRSLRSFAVSLEWNHFGQEILPDDDDRLAKMLRNAMQGQPSQDTVLPCKVSKEPSADQKQLMSSYFPKLCSKLDGCSLGFRFGKPGKFLWVDSEERLSGPPDDPGWELRYVINEDFTDGPDFVSVVRLPYTRQAWESWRAKSWGERLATDEEVQTPTFAASLVIPANSSAQELLVACDEELEGMMNFLQVYVFTNILFDLTVQSATERERGDIGAGMFHNLRHYLAALQHDADTFRMLSDSLPVHLRDDLSSDRLLATTRSIQRTIRILQVFQRGVFSTITKSSFGHPDQTTALEPTDLSSTTNMVTDCLRVLYRSLRSSLRAFGEVGHDNWASDTELLFLRATLGCRSGKENPSGFRRSERHELAELADREWCSKSEQLSGDVSTLSEALGALGVIGMAVDCDIDPSHRIPTEAGILVLEELVTNAVRAAARASWLCGSPLQLSISASEASISIRNPATLADIARLSAPACRPEGQGGGWGRWAVQLFCEWWGWKTTTVAQEELGSGSKWVLTTFCWRNHHGQKAT